MELLCSGTAAPFWIFGEKYKKDLILYCVWCYNKVNEA